MAMPDTKTEQNVPPEYVDEVVRRYLSFGWKKTGQSETKTNDSQIKTGQDENYEYFTTIKGEHSYSLFFERDREQPHYDELKSLEEQFYALKVTTKLGWERPQFITKFWLILIVIGLLLWVIPGIILLIFHIVSYKKNSKLWDSIYDKYQKELASVTAQREEILTKAQALV